MNKNSNSYIIIYSTVMVVVVAALLAVASPVSYTHLRAHET